MSVEDILKEVCELNESEGIYPLSKRQVANILNEILRYRVTDLEDIRIALEYSVKMRAQIMFSINHITKPYKPIYNWYTSMRYPVAKVLSIMGIENIEYNMPPYEDFNIINIKDGIALIEMELKDRIKPKKMIKKLY